MTLSFESTAWLEILSHGAAEMNIPVTDDHLRACAAFATLLSDWNKRINLTRITEPGDVAIKHFLDSMAALPHLPEEGRLLDIGSGGGFPGLVLAIFRPRLEVTSIDSVRKKISFQQHLIRTLGLANARALHIRAEDLAAEAEKEGEKGKYHIVTSRALGSMELLLRLSLPLLTAGGRMVAYKGDEEAEEFPEKDASLHITRIAYSLPGLPDKRSLVFIQP